MALGQGATGGNGNTPGSVTTLSITGFTVTGANTVLYVCVFSNTIDTSWHAGCTCIWDASGANESFTQIAQTTGSSTSAVLFRLINPTAGASKTISLAGLYTSGTESAIAALFTGADQTTPNDTVDIVEDGTSDQTPISSGTITSPSGDWIVGFCNLDTNNSASILQQGGTPAVVQNTGNNNGTMGYDTDQDGVDDTFDWSWSTANARKTLFTFNLNAVGAAAADLPYHPWMQRGPVLAQ